MKITITALSFLVITGVLSSVAFATLPVKIDDAETIHTLPTEYSDEFAE